MAFLLLVAMVTNSTGVVSVSMEIFDYGCLVMTAFSQTRHIAPSLRLFVPNGLTEYNNPFLLDVSVVQSSWWLFYSCSRCSLLKTAHPEWLCSKVLGDPGALPSSWI
jgi:hypothetical protein